MRTSTNRSASCVTIARACLPRPGREAPVPEAAALVTHRGGCHCGAIAFEVDAPALSEYTFNTGTARHLFCRRCGVKSFYVPRSNPEGYSVNVRCLDQSTLEHIDIEPFDDEDRAEARVRERSRP